MTHNPYQPPAAKVEDVHERPAVQGRWRFWVQFYLWPFGRTGRLFYWVFAFVPFTVIGAGFVFVMARFPVARLYYPIVLPFIVWLQAVMFARRLHDMKRSGWWAVLFWLVPLGLAYLKVPALVGAALAQFGGVLLGCIPGTRGTPVEAEHREKPDPSTTLLSALERHSQGDETALFDIRAMAKRFGGSRVVRETSLSPQQVRWIELLLDEWQGMFSFVPGRAEGLPHLISLLKWIRANPGAEPLDLYEQAGWKRIVELRGPVEAVMMTSCAQCKTTYPRMGTSGFLDIVDLLCAKCGAVTFKSTHDRTDTAACPCGGVAQIGCPSCGSTEGAVIDEKRPDAYFATHAYYERDWQLETPVPFGSGRTGTNANLSDES